MMIKRATARVILADPADRVLLFGFIPPDPWPGDPAWHLPGGAIEPGESAAQAGCREAYEETGFVLVPEDLGEPVAVNAGHWSRRGSRYHSVNAYFFARVPEARATMPHDDGLGHRWFTAAELAAVPERVFPPGLPALLPGLLRGVRPEQPVTLDW